MFRGAQVDHSLSAASASGHAHALSRITPPLQILCTLTFQMAEMDEVQGPAGISAKVEVEITDCPVHLVVVYPDRAEVCSRTGLGSFSLNPRVYGHR